MDFESKIQKAYVIDKSTCLGIGEHEQFKGSNLEMRDGILKFRIEYTYKNLWLRNSYGRYSFL